MTSKVVAATPETEQFEALFNTIDSMVTGALFAGADPEKYQGLLSLWFLRFALNERLGQVSEEYFDTWCKDVDKVWTPVIERVMDFAESIDEIEDVRDIAELRYLRDGAKIGQVPKDVSELDERRTVNKIIDSMDWLLFKFGIMQDLVDESIVEIALLVVWFKLAALQEQIDDETYVAIKQNWQAVQLAYEKVMNKKWMSNAKA